MINCISVAMMYAMTDELLDSCSASSGSIVHDHLAHDVFVLKHVHSIKLKSGIQLFDSMDIVSVDERLYFLRPMVL